jgi:3-hydroxyisobutyrate dehydrogenase
MTAAGEAMALGDALGLDRGDVLDVVANSPVGGVIQGKRDTIEARTYPASFKLSLARKDLQLVNDAADNAGLGLKLVPAALAWLDQTADAGFGDLDYSSVIETITARTRGVLSPAAPS